VHPVTILAIDSSHHIGDRFSGHQSRPQPER
jgi:hypothetical protein